MRLPIIADYSGDVAMFETVDEAERYIEHYDVEAGNVRCFDAEGSLLPLTVIGKPPAVRISAGQPGDAADELRRVLSNFLRQVRPEALRPEPTLDEVVHLVFPYAAQR